MLIIILAVLTYLFGISSALYWGFWDGPNYCLLLALVAFALVND